MSGGGGGTAYRYIEKIITFYLFISEKKYAPGFIIFLAYKLDDFEHSVRWDAPKMLIFPSLSCWYQNWYLVTNFSIKMSY